MTIYSLSLVEYSSPSLVCRDQPRGKPLGAAPPWVFPSVDPSTLGCKSLYLFASLVYCYIYHCPRSDCNKKYRDLQPSVEDQLRTKTGGGDASLQFSPRLIPTHKVSATSESEYIVITSDRTDRNNNYL